MRRTIRPGECISEVIIRAVAFETDRDPMDLKPFADSFDPDAVDSLFTRSSQGGPRSLTLLYEGCRVTVEEEAVTVEVVPAT